MTQFRKYSQKNKVWLWRAIDGVTRHPLEWQIDHRGDSTLIKLLTKLIAQTCFFITDEWPGFFRLLPQDRHFYGKDLTFPIEQTHSDIRHRLACFVNVRLEVSPGYMLL